MTLELEEDFLVGGVESYNNFLDIIEFDNTMEDYYIIGSQSLSALAVTLFLCNNVYRYDKIFVQFGWVSLSQKY